MAIKEDIILIGGGGHCKACIDVIEEDNRYVIMGIIDFPEKIGQSILGYPIIDCDENLEKITKEFNNFFITVGFIKSSKRRVELYNQIRSFGGSFPSIYSPKSHISKYAEVGEGTIVMHGAIINADAKVGNNCIINNQALIEHDVIVSDNTHISTGARINGECCIGENCFIGSGTIINHCVNVNSDIIIGSGSVVRKDIIVSGIYVGNPLRKIK